MPITREQLQKLVHSSQHSNVDKYLHSLNDSMRFETIDTGTSDFGNTLRMSAFIATVLHESMELEYVVEIASGEAYEGRKDLGNVQPGDGVRFKGRGLIQITGRSMYAKCGSALGVPLIEKPELLETPELAARSAGWFWSFRGLDLLSEQFQFGKVCQRVNGGFNGLDRRIEYYVQARMVLSK